MFPIRPTGPSSAIGVTNAIFTNAAVEPPVLAAAVTSDSNISPPPSQNEHQSNVHTLSWIHHRGFYLEGVKHNIVSLYECLKHVDVLGQVKSNFPKMPDKLWGFYGPGSSLRKTRNFIAHGEAHCFDYGAESIHSDDDFWELLKDVPEIESELNSMKRSWDLEYTKITHRPVFQVEKGNLGEGLGHLMKI